MVCYFPLAAYPKAVDGGSERKAARPKSPALKAALAAGGVDARPKVGRTFSGTKSLIEGMLYRLPCGVCLGCRIDRAEGWAIRSHHEAQMHRDIGSSFVTLTYADEHLPPENSVSLKELQKFVRRLRDELPPEMRNFRYQQCGEYGEKLGRAHYHLILFGVDFPDKRLHQVRRGNRLYTSELLERAWPYGFAPIGSVSFHSARYVASYVMKKIGGDRAEDHYRRVNPETGETWTVAPEFQTSSKRPGLGHDWFQQFKSDVYPSDFIVIDGKKRKPPRYYDKLLPEAELEAVKRRRRAKSFQSPEDRSKERMWVRNLCAELRVQRLEQERAING